MPNTLNTHAKLLERKFSADILIFLNSISESDIRRFMATFPKEPKNTRASNAEEAYALLENNPASKIRENSTQLLREIREHE